MLRAAPGYWQNETSGELRPAVERYVRNEPMSQRDITLMCAYLKQWIEAPGFFGDEVMALRESVGAITTRAELEEWMQAADDAGVDPL